MTILYANASDIDSRKAGNEYCADVRGNLAGKRAPRFVWDALLNHELSWTPVKGIAFNKDYHVDNV